MKNIGREVKVGLFAAVTLVALYLGYYFLKGVDFFESRRKYYAIYDNIDQLERGNKVLVSGSAVGRVSNLKLLTNGGFKVLVELEIDSDITLGDSTRAILTSEIIGGKYILLYIGPVREPLKSGDTIRTEIAKGLLDVFAGTAKPVADNLQTTLRNFNLVIENLEHNTRNLDTIFVKLKRTPDLLNHTIINTNGKIEDLSVSFKAVTENINTTLSELKPTLTNFRIISDSLRLLEINQTLKKAQATIASLNEVVGKLKKRDNSLGKLLNEDSLYRNLNVLVKRLDTLVVHFDSDPKQFTAPLGMRKSKIARRRKADDDRKKKAAAGARK